MVGASYGAGNYGMAGKSYNPRFVFTWPNHRIAVMGPEPLAGVMDIIARSAAAGRGQDVDEEALEGLGLGHVPAAMDELALCQGEVYPLGDGNAARNGRIGERGEDQSEDDPAADHCRRRGGGAACSPAAARSPRPRS